MKKQKRRTIIDLGGLSVPFIELEDLIKNKSASARAQDIVDVENLRKIMNQKKDK